jgi:lipopolysaccharide biosynthesis glycosyltransferase
LFSNNQDLRFRVFVITDGLLPGDHERLRAVVAARRHQLEWLTIDQDVFRDAHVSGHVSIATYFRIVIPAVLPQDVEKVLFLDSDIVVRRSIAEFYETPLDDYTHAAVENPLMQADVKRLGIPENSPYFNAGVLLLNVRRWRDECLTMKLLDYINVQATKLRWHDQDALNATLHGRWRKCPPTWNAQQAVFCPFQASELGVSEQELHEARSNPSIVHFTGSEKPWMYSTAHPFKRDYYRYLAQTPWRGYSPPDRPSLTARLFGAASRMVPDWAKARYRLRRQMDGSLTANAGAEE